MHVSATIQYIVYSEACKVSKQHYNCPHLLSKARKFAKSARWFGRTEFLIGPFLLVTDTIQIQYSLKGWRDHMTVM